MEKYVVLASQAFVVVFVVSIPFSYFGAKHRSWVTDNSFFEAVNYTFVAGFGVLCFTGAYCGYTIGEWLSGRRFNVRQILNRFSKYILYVVWGIIFNAWFFGPSLLERLNKATGGHCTDGDASTKTIAQCRGHPSFQWVDGFDLSGHYYFVVTSSLILIDVIAQEHILVDSKIPADTVIKKQWIIYTKAASLMRWLSQTLIAIWAVEFCITSIFFHTVWEKALGLLGIPIALGICSITNRILRKERFSEQKAIV